MKSLIMGLAMVAALSGCDKRQTAPPDASLTTPVNASWSDAVTTDQVFINYIKTWHMQMTPSISLSVKSTYEPWLTTDCDTYCSFVFTLQQGDDAKKWVVFDCDAVAEKILQQELVSVAQKDCSLLRDEARRYWKDNSDPSEYTDPNGRVWKRQ